MGEAGPEFGGENVVGIDTSPAQALVDGPNVETATASSSANPAQSKDKPARRWWWISSSTPKPPVPSQTAAVVSSAPKVPETPNVAQETVGDAVTETPIITTPTGPDLAIRQGVERVVDGKTVVADEPATYLESVDEARISAIRSQKIMDRQRTDIGQRYLPRIGLTAAGAGSKVEAGALQDEMDQKISDITDSRNVEVVDRTQSAPVNMLLRGVLTEFYQSGKYAGPGRTYDTQRRYTESDMDLLAAKFQTDVKDGVDGNGDNMRYVDFQAGGGRAIRFHQGKEVGTMVAEIISTE